MVRRLMLIHPCTANIASLPDPGGGEGEARQTFHGASCNNSVARHATLVEHKHRSSPGRTFVKGNSSYVAEIA